MKFTFRTVAAAVLLLTIAAGLYWSSASLALAAGNEENSAAAPVEDDMHEFMEYVFQPTYRQLRPQMASKPGGGGAWSKIKSNALILAEGGNLLLIRGPQQDRADWTRRSAEVREHGGKLYRAAKSKDFAAARRHYEAMLQDCNACHDQFAGGEHQLTP